MDRAIDGSGTDRRPSTSILSSEGVEFLSKNPTAENRTVTAACVGAAFADGRLSTAEKNSAAAVLELLSRDEALQVRQAVCEELLDCSSIPTRIARTLAQDVESIAVPFLRRAKALADVELVEFIRDGNTLKQVSIARRDIVSPAVSHELVRTAKKTVVKTILTNAGADISEQSLLNVVADFGRLPSVQSLMIDRAELPAAVTQHLVSLVSGPLIERLVEQHHVPPPFIGGLLEKSGKPVSEPGFAVVPIGDETNLAPTTVLKILCEGNFDFFVVLMASLAGVSAGSARTLIKDAGKQGFSALYAHTGLPMPLFAAYRIALDIEMEIRREGRTEWDHGATQRMIERLGQAYDNVGGESLDLVLERLS